MIAEYRRQRSTTGHRSPENVGIVPIVEAERKLREIQRQIFLAHIVVSADDSTLQQRPEGVDVLSMYFAAHILTRAMRHSRWLPRQQSGSVPL